MSAAISDILWASERNIERVDNLVKIYRDQLGGSGSGRKPVNSTDLLRAAVVFLHSTVEDFLREIAQLRLPFAAEGVINGVPLAGLRGRPEKFFLGKLTNFRGITVDELLEKSVAEYLDRFTVNNIPELERLLEWLDLTPDGIDDYKKHLGELMERRHHIVHQADKSTTTGRGTHRTRSIRVSQIDEWTWAVKDLISDIASAFEDNS